MKLWYSKSSPVVRKVMTVAHHHQLTDQIEICEASAFSAESGHNKANPVGKVPALEVSPGNNLFDSRVIAEYLDSMGSQSKVFLSGEEKWHDLTLQSLADGILDNAIPILSELFLRPGEPLWPERKAQFRQRIESSLALVEKNVASLNNTLSIGTISLTCIADFLVIRQEMLNMDVKAIAPNLYKWVDAMNAQHACLSATHFDNI